ncbi:uncharacterized protein MKK02DRAFT_30544 [Dioszegia hungarica]|uniref:Uncharacterized protein n=1 Tax=Dioszegia hungarica TaxID=4972 RepID=A0AA38H5D5_9TREE|nr:uncharacterized protein MKK02DRAFT_30544 [Dioszegia hungarica]KAI9632814.1 hypothetical protein MKK02DRAFT_30544 [Dioszegia hungarica]
MLRHAAVLLSTALVGFAALVPRQAVITTAVYPAGVASQQLRFESGIPLACSDGCYYFSIPYTYCFLYDRYFDGSAIPAGMCDSLCSQQYYDGLSQCLNCVVANGGERPLGYSANTALTTNVIPSFVSGGENVKNLVNPNGFLNSTQANGWLGNVTSLCASKGKAIATSSSITATATTTGPYAATWFPGQTIARTTWTGLTQYGPPTVTVTATSGAVLPLAVYSSGAGLVTSGAAASQSSRAAGMSTVERAPLGWTLGGALLAWAVL